ncbi:Maintenance of telomere capping protein 2 [Nakaseomyces bracarensis]|uniref:Maintenance of telomere capping protein 2 n=1 Tax=Nakaseomyces bracarensis TaxID=273131 RepID=A0ABR4NZT5_9SACH
MDIELDSTKPYKVPSFPVTLLLSIVARKNFIVLFDKDREGLNEGVSHEQLLKESIDKTFEKCVLNYDIKYHMVGKITDELIEEVRYKDKSTHGPSSEQEIDREDDDHTKLDDDRQLMELYIIEDINTRSLEDYTELGKLMREGYLYNVRHNRIPGNKPHWKLFIGTVLWNRDDYNIPEDVLNMGKEDKKYSHKHGQSFKFKSFATGFEDWIRHKFWLVTTIEIPTIKPVIEVEDVDEQQSFDSVVYTKEKKNSNGPAVEKEVDEEDGDKDVDDEVTKNYEGYENIHIQASLRRYLLDIMVHIRTHRLSFNARGGGVHKNSYSDIIILSRLIAIRDNRKFVTPQHVRLASMWYFPSQLSIIDDSMKDNSILYGSKPELVRELMKRLVFVRNKKIVEMNNPLFIEALIVRNAIKKIVPPV